SRRSLGSLRTNILLKSPLSPNFEQAPKTQKVKWWAVSGSNKKRIGRKRILYMRLVYGTKLKTIGREHRDSAIFRQSTCLYGWDAWIAPCRAVCSVRTAGR